MALDMPPLGVYTPPVVKFKCTEIATCVAASPLISPCFFFPFLKKKAWLYFNDINQEMVLQTEVASQVSSARKVRYLVLLLWISSEKVNSILYILDLDNYSMLVL